MKPAKRIIAATAATALCVGMLAGCGGGAASSAATETTEATSSGATASGDKTTLTVWHTWGAGPGLDAMQAIVDKYNETMGYAMILTNQGGAPVITGDATLDITDEVIAGLNEEYVATKAKK